jgi:hypothetical protein
MIYVFTSVIPAVLLLPVVVLLVIWDWIPRPASGEARTGAPVGPAGQQATDR